VTVTCLAVGSRVAYDGAVWTVVALGGDRVTVEESSGGTRSVRIAYLLSAPGSRLLDPPGSQPGGAVGPLLANLTELELAAVCERAGHVREVLTGYRSGSPDDAVAGEPRAGYRPGTAMMDRYPRRGGAQRGGEDPAPVGAVVSARWGGGVDRRPPSSVPPIRCAGSILAGWMGCAPCWMSMLARADPRGSCCSIASMRGSPSGTAQTRSRSDGRRGRRWASWSAARTRWRAARRPSGASRTVLVRRMGGWWPPVRASICWWTRPRSTCSRWNESAPRC